ncbi:hypothetical protein WMY93_024286 [Mugilogobius chulae]|uniref:Uncharacterized protein n=1 Tax=Mugilogobius chulae TaxID=88201 RepID=A0AAW0NBS4_9GOBI
MSRSSDESANAAAAAVDFLIFRVWIWIRTWLRASGLAPSSNTNSNIQQEEPRLYLRKPPPQSESYRTLLDEVIRNLPGASALHFPQCIAPDFPPFPLQALAARHSSVKCDSASIQHVQKTQSRRRKQRLSKEVGDRIFFRR